MAHGGPICDPHLHFWDFDKRPNPNIQGGIEPKLGPRWLPADYLADAASLDVVSVVHVETIDEVDPLGETAFVNALQPALGRPMRLVCFVDLSLPTASEQLAQQAGLPNVVGVRHIVNHEPSWPNVKEDYLSNAAFRANYLLLAEHRLSFDMQLNPHQMVAAAEFVKQVPQVNVCVNHMGCLKLTGGEGDAEVLATWRAGIAALASLPHVYIKLSMLPYTAAGWWGDAADAAAAQVRSLVREVVSCFGAKRCMFASNYPVDKLDGLDMETMYACFRKWTEDYSPEDQRALFHDTAAAFYKLL